MPMNDGWDRARRWAGKIGFDERNPVRLSKERPAAVGTRPAPETTRDSTNHDAQRRNGSDSRFRGKGR